MSNIEVSLTMCRMYYRAQGERLFSSMSKFEVEKEMKKIVNEDALYFNGSFFLAF